MNIYAKSGDKVVFINENGHEWEREEARKTLSFEEVLTVRSVDIGGFSSRVEFNEHPEKYFNTVMFDDLEASTGIKPAKSATV